MLYMYAKCSVPLLADQQYSAIMPQGKIASKPVLRL